MAVVDVSARRRRLEPAAVFGVVARERVNFRA
jgi:hypothetical protein